MLMKLRDCVPTRTGGTATGCCQCWCVIARLILLTWQVRGRFVRLLVEQWPRAVLRDRADHRLTAGEHWRGSGERDPLRLPCATRAGHWSVRVVVRAGVLGVAIVAQTDAAEVERMRAAETRLVAKMEEAIDRELDADEPEEKRRYARRITDFKGQLKLLRRRIASFTSVAAPIEVDTAIKQIIQAGMRSKDRAKRRSVLLALIHEVRYAEGLAELVLKVPTLPGVNCQRSESDVGACQRTNARNRSAAGAGGEPKSLDLPTAH